MSSVRRLTSRPRNRASNCVYTASCSSSVGKSLRTMNGNSLRYRPMPSAPRSVASSTSLSRFTFARTRMPVPSIVLVTGCPGA